MSEVKKIRVRMLKTVESELPRQLWGKSNLVATIGKEYDGTVTPSGIYTIVLTDGSLFGIKPGEFEIAWEPQELQRLEDDHEYGKPIVSRIVEVIPGEEIHIFINGLTAARFIAYPKRQVLTIPGCTEGNPAEYRNWNAALRVALERMGWKK